MARTALELSPEEWRAYDPRLRRRRISDPVRRREAWEAARQAARLLRESFGATRVAVFGSLARSESFYEWSDIDLAVWGAPAEQFYEAAGAVAAVHPDIPFDLVDADRCPESLREQIEKEAIDLP